MPPKGTDYSYLDLPCGQCIGCRLERSRRWAVRLMHEKQMHEDSCFVTLTYDDAHVPADGSLRVEHFQAFMHRLRKWHKRNNQKPGSSTRLRFFHCGEYGEQTARPHYHAIIFGEAFLADRQPYKKSPQGDQLYNSPRLSELWGHGFAVIGDVTFESAAYVARYCLKKITGPRAAEHYGGRKPEYITMSRRPGIGADWYSRFCKEVYPADSVVLRGKEMMPPPFYDKLLEKADPLLFDQVKGEREIAAGRLKGHPDRSDDRLRVREFVKEQTIKNTLKRS